MELLTQQLIWMHPTFNSFDADRAMLDGADGEAARISLKIILRRADMMGARERWFPWLGRENTSSDHYQCSEMLTRNEWRTLGINAKFWFCVWWLGQGVYPIQGKGFVHLRPDICLEQLQNSVIWSCGVNLTRWFMRTVCLLQGLWRTPIYLTSWLPWQDRLQKAGAYINEHCLALVLLRVTPPKRAEEDNDSEPRDVDLVSFGNPHFSFQRLRRLSKL